MINPTGKKLEKLLFGIFDDAIQGVDRDWGKYYHGKEDRTKPHTEYVKDVIKIGEKLNQDGI